MVAVAMLAAWPSLAEEACCPGGTCGRERYTVKDHVIPVEKNLDPAWMEGLFARGDSQGELLLNSIALESPRVGARCSVGMGGKAVEASFRAEGDKVVAVFEKPLKLTVASVWCSKLSRDAVVSGKKNQPAERHDG